jgi:TRAP-type C4-dicarboxylate transport system permease small subunit
MPLLHWLWRGYNALVAAAWWVAIFSAAAMLVLIVADVSIRIAGFRPPAATVGVVEYSLLYLAMLSAPRLVREGQHIVVETVVGALTGTARLVLEKLIYAASALTCAVLGYAASALTLENIQRGALDLRGIDLPAWLLPLPIAVGAGLCMVEFLRFLVTRHSFYSARGTETIL